jgi:hypothetical protein
MGRRAILREMAPPPRVATIGAPGQGRSPVEKLSSAVSTDRPA